MAHILIMPRQGNTVESCIIAGWRVKEGDTVTADDIVCDVETDKATFEVPAGAGGAVLKLLCESGDDVPVLKPIAVIGAAGEDYAAALKDAGGGESPPSLIVGAVADAAASGGGSAPATPPPGTGSAATGASPRARNLAGREGLPLAGLSGSGPGGRVIEQDVRAALEGRPPLTLAAKAALAAGGLDVQGGASTGLGGRRTAAGLSAAPAARSAGGGAVGAVLSGENPFTETPVKGIRKVIANRMLQSLAESAQFTLNRTAPAERLLALRARMKEAAKEGGAAAGGIFENLGGVTVNDLVLYAVSRVLPLFSYMNAHKIEDTVRIFERVHLGLAVDTPRGLMVPVIRDANLRSLAGLSAEAKRLARAAQDGSVKPDELSGSTFTVSNLGSLGISSFTPVLNTPEVAILGVAAIEARPVPAENGYSFEQHIGFSLTVNHQVVDGAPAARFLQAFCNAVRDIDLLLAC